MTTEARLAPAGLEGRSAGWRIVARKEFADHLSSARFIILLLLLGAATLVPLYFASDAIKSIADQVADTRGAFLILFLATSSGNPVPSVLTFVSIVAPLLGVAFAFDAINSERSRDSSPSPSTGTMSSTASSPRDWRSSLSSCSRSSRSSPGSGSSGSESSPARMT